MHSFESEKIRFPGKCFLKKFSESDYNEFPELQNLNSERVYILHGDEEKLPLCHSIIQRWKKSILDRERMLRSMFLRIIQT